MKKQEKSCGAIVFHDTKDSSVLIIQQKDGHWCFPKGHILDGENDEQCAIREIEEETGYVVSIDSKFHCVVHYPIHEHIEKEVVYFIAYVKSGKPKVQTSELIQMHWQDPLYALGCITYENDAIVLKKALEYRNIKW